MLYEPKYGNNDLIEDFNPEYRAVLEDFVINLATLGKDKTVNPTDTCVALMKDEGRYCYYFAIGSMMNIISITNRKIFPKESFPAEALDHILEFGGGMGMGIATPKEGESFHGVVHKVTESHMKLLDSIERGYVRKTIKCRKYDGTEIEASIYTDADGNFDRSADKPPSERYINIMTDGARMFGVEQSHIDWLTNHECVPRKDPADFNSHEVPEGDIPTWTNQELRDAKMHYAINGKVIKREFLQNTPKDISGFKKNYEGKHVEIALQRLLYEPKYGIKDKIEDFEPEHRAHCEDTLLMVATMGKDPTVYPTDTVVGLIEY